MTGNQWMRLSAALSFAAVLGCAKGEQATADSTARNLTLAPTESTPSPQTGRPDELHVEGWDADVAQRRRLDHHALGPRGRCVHGDG